MEGGKIARLSPEDARDTDSSKAASRDELDTRLKLGEWSIAEAP